MGALSMRERRAVYVLCHSWFSEGGIFRAVQLPAGRLCNLLACQCVRQGGGVSNIFPGT